MAEYLLIVFSSILLGLVAITLYRRSANFDPKVFWTAALVNAAALLALLYNSRRRRT